MNYVKLENGSEYKIADNGKDLLHRHIPSAGNHWYIQNTGIQKIIDILPESDTNVKCLLEDGKWYHIGSDGFLTLTFEQLEKDRQEKDAIKKSKTEKEKESKSEKDSVAPIPVETSSRSIFEDKKISRDLLV